MPSFPKLLTLVLDQKFSRQSLARTPEPTAAMDEAESVEQFNHALESKLVIAYAGALEVIHRARRFSSGGLAIDLCCGPGHLTLFLAKYFEFEKVIGVDLSPTMIEKARENAAAWGLADRVEFEVANVLNLPRESRGTFDLVTCNDAAHHFPSLEVVRELVTTMDELATDQGMTFMMDLVRLKRQQTTQRYVEILGQDYLDRGWDRFYRDFEASMHAAWTEKELASVLPNESDTRQWWQLKQRLLPTIQMAVGLPSDSDSFFVRRGQPWPSNDCPIPKHYRADWRLFRRLLHPTSCSSQLS